MAESAGNGDESLFNDPTFSDIKIRQIYNGETKEYFAHKAVLCAHSKWFLKALTGRFKEASESIIEVHDDDPQTFEIMLKFFYAMEYQCKPSSPTDWRKKDSFERYIMLPVKLYTLADMYDMKTLRIWSVKTFRENAVGSHGTYLVHCWEAVVAIYYENCLSADSLMGKAVADVFYAKEIGYIRGCGNKFDELARRYPVFGVDVLLDLKAKKQLKGM